MDEPAPRAATVGRRLLLLGVGVTALVVLALAVDLERLRAAVAELDIALYVVAALLVGPVIGLRAVRWQQLLRARGIASGFRPALAATLIGQLLGMITPGRLGELARALPLARDAGVDVARVLPSVIIDRMLDLAALMLIALPALVSAFEVDGFGSPGRTVALLAVAALGLPIVFNPRLAERLGERLEGAMGRRRSAAWIAGLLGEYAAYLRAMTLDRLAAVVALTLAVYLVFFLEAYLVAVALDMNQSFLTLAFAVTLGAVVALIPVSFSGIGTRDAAIVAYLGLHGVDPAQALAFSLLLFIAFQAVGGLAGLAAYASRGRLG